MSDLSLRRFETALAGRRPDPLETPRRAAVAALLRWDDPEDPPKVLLMRRAERVGDRWSGHVSFPGGREELRDASLYHTAVRETEEEVGLDLERCARFLGGLDPVRAIARGRPTSTSIAPYVFVETSRACLTTNHEVARTFWLPLGAAAAGELDAVHVYQLGAERWELPCWRYDGETVWGLTYQMLGSLLALVRP